MKETIIFTIGVIAVIGIGVLVFRRKPKEELASDEQLQHTLDRAAKSLTQINDRIEKLKVDPSYDDNPGLRQFALKGEYEFLAIIQNVYDTTLKVLNERKTKMNH